MEMGEFTGKPQDYKNVGSPHTDVKMNVALADSKIYMEKQRTKNHQDTSEEHEKRDALPTIKSSCKVTTINMSALGQGERHWPTE